LPRRLPKHDCESNLNLYYNFVRIHKTLKTMPAMAAGVTSQLCEIGDIVDVLEAWEQSGAGRRE
jgi:hypothetical protein